MSRVQCELESDVQGLPRMRYNITELVLEISSKAQRIDKLESTLEEARQQHKDEVKQLEQKIQSESDLHTHEYMNQSEQIHHLDLLLQQEHMKRSTMEGSVEPSQDPRPGRRRRHFRGKLRANKDETSSVAANNDVSDEPVDMERVESLPPVKEESF